MRRRPWTSHLTKRGQHKGQDIPMCGVPVHAAEGYLSRLIRKGFKVAICEQLETRPRPKKRGYKAVVRRDVVRLVTPGTLTEDELLDARAHNYLAALADAGGSLALAWLDISTGDFQTQPAAAGNLGCRPGAAFAGRDCCCPNACCSGPTSSSCSRSGRTVCPPCPRRASTARTHAAGLEELQGVKALDAFGDFDRAELAAAGALVDYVLLTQKGEPAAAIRTQPRLPPAR